MDIDLDRSVAAPAPDRGHPEARFKGPTQRKSGARREYDGRGFGRSFPERVDRVVRDVGAFRVVSERDLTERHFDGHRFVARRAVKLAEQRGWVKRWKAKSRSGGEFAVIVATKAGAQRAAALWKEAGRRGQKVWSGEVKANEVAHEAAVYRAAVDAERRIKEAGGVVVGVRIDAELKSRLARAGELARKGSGREAADEERRRVALELGVPMDNGSVLLPDVQLSYVSAAGIEGRCNVEVASEHYGAGAIQAKAKAGFQIYAGAGRASAVVRRALALTGGGGKSKSGGGGREPEVFEL